MQRQFCREFIASHPDWVLQNEFYEKGVSGFKKSAKERDAMQELQQEAVAGSFDILLVYMFDRLGRRDDETPFVVEWFVRNGVEVWSAVEGQQRFDNHVDKLLNYIRYWQASGESIKTSVRVKTRMEQLTKDGCFTGGIVPFGYKLQKQGRINKKNQEVNDFVIDEDAAEIVRFIFYKYVNEGYGAQRIAWGLAKKLILADRAYVFSKAVFADLNTYSGMYVIVALLTFSIYEYCDFSGGIDVVIGVSELFGIRLDENFRQPYFSKSIGEFWRRWHITLGTWMKDYIFYPFSISKKMLAFGKKAKKIFGKKTGKILPICVANLLIFFVVGVWHGAAWKYIIYGLYNGLIIAASNLLKPYYAKWAAVCHVNMESRGWKTFQIFRTFILVNIGWLFDACATATTAFYAMRAVFINFKISILTDGSLYKLGLVKRDWTILIVATIILFISSVMKEKGMSLRDFVAERPLVVRWAVYLILIFATAPFGYVSSSTEFMYAQF